MGSGDLKIWYGGFIVVAKFTLLSHCLLLGEEQRIVRQGIKRGIYPGLEECLCAKDKILTKTKLK